MKYSRSAVHRRLHKIPALRFETQTLTSFGGLVLFQALNARLRLKERLGACFSHLPAHPIFGHHVVVLLLVIAYFASNRNPEQDKLKDTQVTTSPAAVSIAPIPLAA